LKGRFVRPEAEVLESLRLAFFDDLTVPIEEEPLLGPVQQDLDYEGGDEPGEGQEDADEEAGEGDGE